MQPEIKEMFEYSDRLKQLPPYWAREIDEEITRRRDAGHDVISLGIGDPDLPTPKHVVDACCEAARDPENHPYPTSEGMLEFRKAVAYRTKEDCGVTVNPKTEVTSLIGSKEGLVHVQFAFVGNGDYVLYPAIGYSPNWIGTIFAGGRPYQMPTTIENGFLPDFESIPSDIVRKTKLMITNFPNNPTGAIATEEFYKKVVDFAKDNKIMVINDEAYSKIYFDGHRHKSFLEIEGAKEIGAVLDSCSKTYNMTGWRIGWAVGNEDIIKGILKSKSNMDSGQSRIIQKSAIAALEGPQDCVKENLKIYQERRKVAMKGLDSIGVNYFNTPATFYLWCWKDGQNGVSLAKEFLEKDVVVSPGKGFEKPDSGFANDYFRISLTQKTDKIRTAFDRMETKLYA